MVRQLVDLMKEHDLTEIALQVDTSRVRLRKGPLVGAAMAAPAMNYAPPAPARAAESANSAPAAPPAEAVATTPIKSPTVGTFYLQATPDAPPYVKVGSAITADTIVCMVEAMKVFNEIPAGIAGTVTEILVENATPVEFGQPLFRVKTG
ncbi:MAG TPA: acetyl-CoA carboxylase biotin carboxyl carrier protein [Planctomycetia bacterium]|nr:acetyl-CoA carboxylase biotin carboxyl carrier protein [Planctomycetia bacterium]